MKSTPRPQFTSTLRFSSEDRQAATDAVHKFLDAGMEGILALRDTIEKDDLMCKLDLKDAYVAIPVHEESKKFLGFKHQNCEYQYESLAFGQSVAPRVFKKKNLCVTLSSLYGNKAFV